MSCWPEYMRANYTCNSMVEIPQCFPLGSTCVCSLKVASIFFTRQALQYPTPVSCGAAITTCAIIQVPIISACLFNRIGDLEKKQELPVSKSQNDLFVTAQIVR